MRRRRKDKDEGIHDERNRISSNKSRKKVGKERILSVAPSTHPPSRLFIQSTNAVQRFRKGVQLMFNSHTPRVFDYVICCGGIYADRYKGVCDSRVKRENGKGEGCVEGASRNGRYCLRS